jgi:hypothetical protein
MLLQILPHFSGASKLKDLLIHQFTQDANYLVRANTYAALRILAERGAISLSIDELRHLREKESSSYAIQRLIGCYSVASGEAVWLVLASLVTTADPERTAAVARACCRLFGSRRLEPAILDGVLPAFMRIDTLNVESYIHLLHLTARFGTSWMISEVFEKARQRTEGLADRLLSIVALEAIQWFASRAELGHLLLRAEMFGGVGLE